MSTPRISIPRIGNDVDRVSDAITPVLRFLIRGLLVESRLIEDVPLTTATKEVLHGLGRVPNGYFVVRSNAAATVRDTAMDATKITLAASATVTVSLLVF